MKFFDDSLDSIRNFLSTITAPVYQFIAMGISLCLIVLIAYKPYETFKGLETAPRLLHPISPLVVNAWGSQPALVNVGLKIQSFSEFNVNQGVFGFDGIIWFEFDPAYISLDTIGKFSFIQGTITKKSAPITTSVRGGKVSVQYSISVTFKTDLNYTYFPLDDHRLYITLTNSFISPNEILFESMLENFKLARSVNILGWNVTDTYVRNGYTKELLKNDVPEVTLHPLVVFMLDIKRSGLQGILLIFLPLFLVAFIAVFSLGFNPTRLATVMLTLASGSLLGIISYRFIIQNLSPQTGYLMLSDHIFFLFFTFLFIVYIFAISLIHKGAVGEDVAAVRGLVFLIFHLTVLGWWYYILYY